MTEEREILLQIIKQKNCDGIICVLENIEGMPKTDFNQVDCPLYRLYCTTPLSSQRPVQRKVQHACILYAKRYGTEDILEYLM